MKQKDRESDNLEALAKAVREACLAAALKAYEDAGISGICLEGRWDLAVDALKNVDLKTAIDRTRNSK